MLDTLLSSEGVHFHLQWQNPHILFGFGGKGQGLTVVLSISGFHPGEDMVADYVAGIVGQLGGSTFQVREVVLNVILELIEGRRETFVECFMNLGVSIVDREMAEQVAFEILNGVQADKVDPNGVMEVFEVYPETEITITQKSNDNPKIKRLPINLTICGHSGHNLVV